MSNRGLWLFIHDLFEDCTEMCFNVTILYYVLLTWCSINVTCFSTCIPNPNRVGKNIELYPDSGAQYRTQVYDKECMVEYDDHNVSPVKHYDWSSDIS